MRFAVYSIRSVRTRLRQVVSAGLIAAGVVIPAVARMPAQSAPPPLATILATNGATPVEGTPAAEAGEIVWAREIDPATNAPVRRATAFITTDAVIYALLPMERLEQGSVVEATWFYGGTPVPSLTASVTADQTYEDGWIEFHLTRPQGRIWPAGAYTIRIAINGRQVTEATIEVTVPPS